MARREAPDVNAGSMADIAFLLLIFFLVTTTIESDKGITRKLPSNEDEDTETERKEKNILIVILNKEGDLLVDDEPMEISDLEQKAIDFVDNGGGSGDDGCSYCQGNQDPSSSDNPKKAVVAVETTGETKYGKYIAVQNELKGAYNHLRNRAAQGLYNQDFTDLKEDYDDPNFKGDKDEVKEKVKKIRELYPLNISEAKAEKD